MASATSIQPSLPHATASNGGCGGAAYCKAFSGATGPQFAGYIGTDSTVTGATSGGIWGLDGAPACCRWPRSWGLSVGVFMLWTRRAACWSSCAWPVVGSACPSCNMVDPAAKRTSRKAALSIGNPSARVETPRSSNHRMDGARVRGSDNATALPRVPCIGWRSFCFPVPGQIVVVMPANRHLSDLLGEIFLQVAGQEVQVRL